MDSHQFKDLIKSNTCFKKDSDKCIDLIVTNKPKSFQFSNIYESSIGIIQNSIQTILSMILKEKFHKMKII